MSKKFHAKKLTFGGALATAAKIALDDGLGEEQFAEVARDAYRTVRDGSNLLESAKDGSLFVNLLTGALEGVLSPKPKKDP